MADTIIDGERYVSGTDTSKRGYPIVTTGTMVDCAHCDEVHECNLDAENVGFSIPGGHKRYSHWTCRNTEHNKRFAAKVGSSR